MALGIVVEGRRTAEALGGRGIELAPPDRLVALMFEADRVVSY